MTHLLSHRLINRNPRTQVAGALLDADASQKNSVPTGVIATAIFAAVRVSVIQPAEYLHAMLQGRQRR